MPIVTQKYICPRCGYNTNHKNDMKKHLYNRKMECRPKLVDIQLIEEIKDCVLEKYVYVKPSIQPDTNQTTNQIINNYNTINNYVVNMDIFQKINGYTEHFDEKLLSFGDQVERDHQTRIRRLQSNNYKHVFGYTENQFLELIDRSVKTDRNSSFQIEEMNVLFLKNLNKISIYHDDAWEDMLLEFGVIKLVKILQDYYLQYYELYLINQIYSNLVSTYIRSSCVYSLEIYYKFLAYFDLYPVVKGLSDSEIKDMLINTNDFVTNEKNDYHISDKCMEIYNKIIEDLTKSDKNKMRRTVVDIIKSNTNANIDRLNKTLTDAITKDAELKTKLLN